MKPSAKKLWRVHLWGPGTGGGFRRTLCEHRVSATMNATDDRDLVTCAICIWRINNYAARP